MEFLDGAVLEVVNKYKYVVMTCQGAQKTRWLEHRTRE